MGVPNHKLILTNNIKFDVVLTEEDQKTAQDIKRQLDIGDRPVLLGASTHDPEEKTLLSYKTLKKEHLKLLLVITPRHRRY